MREEADAAEACGAVLATLRAVARRVEPRLEHPVGVLASIAASAPPASEAEARARRARVLEPARVPPARLLARVGVGALSPVVGPPARAPPDLELVHAKIVSRKGVGHGDQLVVEETRGKIEWEST